MVRHSFVATCEHRTEGVVRDELVALGIRAPRGGRGRVTFEGPLRDGLRACLHLRSAMRVLLHLGGGPADDAGALYDTARAIDWGAHLGPHDTLAVRARVRDSRTLLSAPFVAQRVKDAVVDQLRERTGGRPSVDRERPSLPIEAHVEQAAVDLYLDLAGEPLHRRGYRVAMTEAPLKETLAAAALALGRVGRGEPFWDPMCGSGTLAIEHALAARAIAPGLRRRFACERWPSQAHAADLAALREEARAAILPHAPAPIWASDVAPAAVEVARANAHAAGVGEDIAFSVRDAGRISPTSASGTLCMNLPYGLRVDASDRRLPQALARALHLFWGWAVVALSPARELGLALGLRPAFTHRLSNGGVPVLLQRYELGPRQPDAGRAGPPASHTANPAARNRA